MFAGGAQDAAHDDQQEDHRGGPPGEDGCRHQSQTEQHRGEGVTQTAREQAVPGGVPGIRNRVRPEARQQLLGPGLRQPPRTTPEPPEDLQETPVRPGALGARENAQDGSGGGRYGAGGDRSTGTGVGNPGHGRRRTAAPAPKPVRRVNGEGRGSRGAGVTGVTHGPTRRTSRVHRPVHRVPYGHHPDGAGPLPGSGPRHRRPPGSVGAGHPDNRGLGHDWGFAPVRAPTQRAARRHTPTRSPRSTHLTRTPAQGTPRPPEVLRQRPGRRGALVLPSRPRPLRHRPRAVGPWWWRGSPGRSAGRP
ncbi:hypothetical protein RKD19_003831 [Streptomyces canus]